MGRQLVVCIDGTNNRFDHRPTNVIRLLRSLPRDPSRLLSYYNQGVGTFGLKETLFEWQKLPARVCGLAFGWGLKRNVEGAYRFLAENHADGDEVYVFGFSRGAFAARALAALLRAAGLVSAHEVHLFDYAWSMLLARQGPQQAPDFKLQSRFKATFGRAVTVRFLGLYDTVKSVGWIYDPVVIPYTASNRIVKVVRHAVSIDERRCFFRQHVWKARPGDETDVKEVWFAGVHSDVGGGYAPEKAQLALITHRWMLGEALACGLRLNETATLRQLGPLQDPQTAAAAAMHDSMTPDWKVAEWIPRRVWNGVDARKHWQIGAMPPLRKPVPRYVPVGASLHRSVVERMDISSLYAPVNLVDRYQVVDDHPALAAFLEGAVQA